MEAPYILISTIAPKKGKKIDWFDKHTKYVVKIPAPTDLAGALFKYSEDFFSLKDDHTWKEEENISIIKINLNDKEKGFRGRAKIAYISNLAGDILESFVITEKKVRVDNEDYTLLANIAYGDNCIERKVTSLEVNEEGSVETKNGFHQIFMSRAAFLLHGIDVPCNIFSDYSDLGQKAILHFPFSIRFRLGIGASNDLNLNSARTQIIYDEVWADFEKMFTETVCDKIKEKVSKEDWE